MIVGYGIHGLGNEAILLFQEMQKFGEKPDNVTFIALLSACSHSGLVTEGRNLFQAMSQEFNVTRQMNLLLVLVLLVRRMMSSARCHSSPVLLCGTRYYLLVEFIET